MNQAHEWIKLNNRMFELEIENELLTQRCMQLEHHLSGKQVEADLFIKELKHLSGKQLNNNN